MKRAGILAVSCALAMSTGAFAQSGPPSAQSPAGSSGSPGTTSPGQTTSGPIGAGTDRTAPTADQMNQARANDTQDFIKKAAAANMAEIQLGQLASTKAESPDVKQFAQMMIDQHTKALDELRDVATAANVTLPTELDKKHQKLHDKLSKLSGREFDREYMEAMVDGHKDVAKMLEKESNQGAASQSARATTSAGGATGSPTTTGTSGTTSAASGATDQQATAWASKTLPTVQSHLQQAKQIEQSLKNENSNKAPAAGAGNDTGSGTTGAGSTGSNTPPE